MKVHLWGSLRPHAGGAEAVVLEARTIRDLLTALGDGYPGMEPYLETGIAVSIDGVIYQNSPGQTIPVGAEVYLLPRLRGG